MDLLSPYTMKDTSKVVFCLNCLMKGPKCSGFTAASLELKSQS